MKFIHCALNTRPRPPETAWPPPVPITVLVVLRLPVRCSGGAGCLRLLRFRRICDVLGYLHLACGLLPGGCSVFLGFNGGLGVRGVRDVSPSVVTTP